MRSPPPKAPVAYSKGRGDTSPPTHHPPPQPQRRGLILFSNRSREVPSIRSLVENQKYLIPAKYPGSGGALLTRLLTKY